MSTIGTTIRSAKRKEMTPAKPMPPDQSTAARGTFPTEQTKLSTAIRGPTKAFSMSLRAAGASVMKRARKKLSGSWPMKPARRKPSRISL